MKASPDRIPCPICAQSGRLVTSAYPGYVDGTFFAIYHCGTCDTQFIDPARGSDLYHAIYECKNLPGYKWYSAYAARILHVPDPLHYLSQRECGYYFARQQLTPATSQLRVLDVGCSYGYLTYALNRIGHDAFGIDIVEAAIESARATYSPPTYECTAIESYRPQRSFDVILLVEVIEHLADPLIVVNACRRLLAENGRLLVSTPNSASPWKRRHWCSDLPPVHRFGFSAQSLSVIAARVGMSCHFADVSRFVCEDDNLLWHSLSACMSRNVLPQPRLNCDGTPFERETSVAHRFMASVMHRPGPRQLCNVLLKPLIRYDRTLCAILSRSGNTRPNCL